jgi:serine/threonine protein kinase
MSIRGFLRGEVSGELVQRVAREAALKYGQEVESLELLETDNWLSTPCVVNDSLFLKIITSQNSFVHGLLTTGRNIGMFSSGTEGFFEHFRTPIEMAEHELWATRRMRELGINAPEPLEAFEYDGVGVLVLEYLPTFETLDTVDRNQVEAVAPELFEFLARMHETGLVHGDLRGENVLLADGHVYFIDATNVRGDAVDDARAYDIACALGTLEPLIGARSAVALADEYHTKAQLLDADRFLNFVNIRPDHDFDAQEVRGEITKLTS